MHGSTVYLFISPLCPVFTKLIQFQKLRYHIFTFLLLIYYLLITKKRSLWGKVESAVRRTVREAFFNVRFHAGNIRGNIRPCQDLNRCNPAFIFHSPLRSPRLSPPSVPKVTPCVKLLDTRHTPRAFSLCFTSLETETA